MSADDDRRLIIKCLKGDEAAFTVLMHRHEERLFNTVYRVVGSVEDAQDVVQDTFINAFQSLASFKGDSQFFTWLYRIAYNTAISHKRKQKGVISIDTGRNGEAAIEPLDNSESNQPGFAIERTERERYVQRCLNQMSPEHRAVLVLKDMDDMKYEEIAVILNVPIGTIRSRLHRARLEFREILEKQDR